MPDTKRSHGNIYNWARLISLSVLKLIQEAMIIDKHRLYINCICKKRSFY